MTYEPHKSGFFVRFFFNISHFKQKAWKLETLWECVKAEFRYFEGLYNLFLETVYFFASNPRGVNFEIEVSLFLSMINNLKFWLEILAN